jgi:hypothetical protein
MSQQLFSKVEIGNVAGPGSERANRRGDWLQQFTARSPPSSACEIPEVLATGFPGNTRT